MFRHLPALLLALLLVATVVSVPATAANREHQQMMADIRMLQEQTQQLQVAITTLADSVKAINGRLDEQAGVARKQFADQKLLVDGIAADLRVVREKIDDNNVRVGSLAQDLDAVRQIVAQIPIVPAAPSDAAAPAAAVPVPSAAAALGQSPERAFNSAWSDYASAQVPRWPSRGSRPTSAPSRRATRRPRRSSTSARASSSRASTRRRSRPTIGSLPTTPPRAGWRMPTSRRDGRWWRSDSPTAPARPGNSS